MLARIKKSTASGMIAAPPSKSMSHRLLIAAGLARGVSVISGIAMSEDVSATMDALRAFGAEVGISGDTVTVRGADISKAVVQSPINCRESGSTLRFFIPIAMTRNDEISFTGYGRLMSRPMEIYEGIANKQGLLFENDGKAINVRGPLESGIYEVQGNISSQFISGLIFALPLLDGDSEIKMIPPVESRPYIDMTLKAVSEFGIKYKADGDTIAIPGGQRYLPADICVESDYSNAAFLDAFNLIGGSVEVTGLSENSLQGDRIYKELFSSLASCRDGKFTADISQCPDLGPILMGTLAMCGGGKLTGTRRLRIKESDRAEAMRNELSKFGIDLTVKENEITVHSGKLRRPETVLDTHNDHRIAMTLAVLCSSVGGDIDNCQVVNKSYASFWRDIISLGIEAELTDD